MNNIFNIKKYFRRFSSTTIFCLALIITDGFLTQNTAAQSLSLGGNGDNTPIEVSATDGIEWQQQNSVFFARGNAKAVRGDIRIFADELRAYYRKNNTNQTEIWRLDAFGKVRIESPSETAYGDHAIYSADQRVLVLDGNNVRLVSGKDTISAEKQLEYWEDKNMAVARGNASVVRENKKLWADVLVAHTRQDKKGKTAVYRVDAFDKVRIVTSEETATADRGIYNVESGIATLVGSVTLKRADNLLQGCRAEVDLNTGISHLFGCGNSSANRVSGTLVPTKKAK